MRYPKLQIILFSNNPHRIKGIKAVVRQAWRHVDFFIENDPGQIKELLKFRLFFLIVIDLAGVSESDQQELMDIEMEFPLIQFIHVDEDAALPISSSIYGNSTLCPADFTADKLISIVKSENN